MADVIEIFADGTKIERDFTQEEIDQIKADKKEFEMNEKLKIEKKLKREALLARLGITEQEASLLAQSL